MLSALSPLAQGASATCVFVVRREDLSVGAGVPSCEGRMGDEAAGAAKTRNGVGGMFTFGGLRPKVLFDVVWKRLKTGIQIS